MPLSPDGWFDSDAATLRRPRVTPRAEPVAMPPTALLLRISYLEPINADVQPLRQPKRRFTQNDRAPVPLLEATDSLPAWLPQIPSVRPTPQLRTRQADAYDLSYHELHQSWDVAAVGPRRPSPHLTAPTQSEPPFEVPDDQNILGSWRVDTVPARFGQGHRLPVVAQPPAVAPLVDYFAEYGPWRPSDYRRLANAANKATAGMAPLPMDPQEVEPAAWDVRPTEAFRHGQRPYRPERLHEAKALWFGEIQLDVLGWSAPTPSARPVTRTAPREAGERPPDTPSGESFAWFVPAVNRQPVTKRIPTERQTEPPWYSSGVSIIVAGPYYWTAGELYVAGAVAGQLVTE